MKMRISIICLLGALAISSIGCSAVNGDEKSRMRNTNRQAYRTSPELAPVAEPPNTGMSWGGSLTTRN